ncbi:hypothetical protein RB195_000098 [Necator americanus]|uniref:Uncharacterized protein n=1 Tax=Necator americanus TaxID=51031 RepID=A0ABR1D7X6_NECAM
MEELLASARKGQRESIDQGGVNQQFKKDGGILQLFPCDSFLYTETEEHVVNYLLDQPQIDQTLFESNVSNIPRTD